MDPKVCPVCCEGHLVDSVEQDQVEYRGQLRDVPMHFAVCDLCGSETTTAQQMRDNKRAYIAIQKEVDKLLSGAEVERVLRDLNLSQSEAAQVFGGGAVALSKYIHNDVKQSASMDRLLRVAIGFPQVFEWMKVYYGLQSSNFHVQITAMSWLSYSGEESRWGGNDRDVSIGSGERHSQVLRVESANAAEYANATAQEVG